MLQRVILAVCVVVMAMGVTGAALAQDDPAAPEDVVTAFYDWYLGYIGMGENFNNPLVDGNYQDSDLLADDFIAHVDELLEVEQIRYDPFLCAQNIPLEIMVEEAAYSDDGVSADVVVRTDFENHALTVQLEQVDETWLITGIECGETRTPEGVVRSFYRWYVDYNNWDGEGERPNALVDGAYQDSELLTPAFIAELDDLLAGEGLVYDPLVCAQDMPGYVFVEQLEEEPDGDSVLVPVEASFGDYEFTVALEREDDQWRIAGVICDAGE
ncbi:MAG: DUF3828 domain-containing protein [Chloroflexi bacterium]|nr:DUF3828 domain-containing protein [Chloroflexota bacterium]